MSSMREIKSYVAGLVGPGIGKLHFVVPDRAGAYAALLSGSGIGQGSIYTSVSTAYSMAVASRNDVICVYPGAYAETASIDWSKANTHLMGMGGIHSLGDYYEPNVVLYTATAAVDYVIDLTGANFQCHDIAIQNAGNSATNYAAVKVNKYGSYFKNVSLMGQMEATTAATAVCGALYIHTDGHTAIFEDCVIGQDVWSVRSGANGGVIRFSGSQPNDGQFRRCTIKSISSTATCAAVAVASGTGIGRGWEFRDCRFLNFSDAATQMNQVFYGPTTTAWWPVHLHNCYSQGYDRWTDETSYRIFGTMPIADDGGGQAIALDETVAGAG